MFGYITINKMELKFKEYDCYHAYYCGLCSTLKNKYGKKGQICLSYDMTFVLILLSSLYEMQENKQNIRCITHPFHKHSSVTNELSEYIADMNLLLSFYKCKDDWMDEHKISSYLQLKLLENSQLQLEKKYPKKAKKIEILLEKLMIGEQENTQNIDYIAGLFGEIMAEILLYKHDEWEAVLYDLGYFLGKFIYLMDAYDDIEKDTKKGNYNPFKERYLDEIFALEMEKILTMMLAHCTQKFEQLPLIYHVEILRNVLYSGVWFHFERITNRRMNQGKKKEVQKNHESI